uniref:Uncharacterized protein n=1 Tax=Panagrolaimus sp. ES5 TaxID=591445 RepID=A0AC34F7K5_9BILA
MEKLSCQDRMLKVVEELEKTMGVQGFGKIARAEEIERNKNIADLSVKWHVDCVRVISNWTLLKKAVKRKNDKL